MPTSSHMLEEAAPLCALLDTVRQFAAREVDALENDRRSALPPSLLDGARDLGLFGLSIPERYGGLGLSLGDTAAIVSEVARADRSLAVTLGLHNGLGTRALVERGDEAQCSAWLPELASGERIASFAATEPGAGSDLTAMRTRVTLEHGVLHLGGDKAYVTNAALAGLTTVLVRAPDDGDRATALVMVPGESPGLVVGPEERKMGLRASSTCSLHFDDVALDPALRLDPSKGGIEQAHRALAWGRTLLSAGCLGTARAALTRTLEHATTRQQFGRPLLALGAVRSHVVAIASNVATIEAVLETVTQAEARGGDIASTSTALKILASELAFDACDRAIQVHGALGFVEDTGVALLARDCRVTRIFEGANDVLAMRLGTALLAGRALFRFDDFRSTVLTDTQCLLGQALEDAVHVVQASYGVTAIQRQPLVLALSRADLALYAASSCLARVCEAPEMQGLLLRHAAGRALEEARIAIRAGSLARSDELTERDIVEGLISGRIEA